MKKTMLFLITIVVAAGISHAQQNAGQGVMKAAGQRSMSWDIASGKGAPAGTGDQGRSLIWSNYPPTGWFGAVTGYIYLDWGTLDPPPTSLPDELIDGFTFSYGTNNYAPGGLTWGIYWFDSCTGWGNMGVQESGFIFNNLPNGYGMPTLPPGYGWIWDVSVDLQGSGYEFLLGMNFGQAMQLFSNAPTTGPAIGSKTGNSANAFDVYYPNGVYNGTYWFTPSVWATFAKELYGPQGQPTGMTYYGQGSRGNDSSLYTSGVWGLNNTVRFFLKPPQWGSLPDLDGWIAASLTSTSAYYPAPFDVTRLIGSFVGGTPFPMNPVFTGDFHIYDLAVPPQAVNMTIYFQGIASDPPINQPPLDLTNGVHS